MTTTTDLIAPRDHTRIESWRKACGMTQEQAARELRVALRTFQRWERGEVSPRGYQKEKLEAALNAGAKGGQ